MSELEELLFEQIKQARLPLPVREFRFLPSRRYRADFAYPDLKLLIEIEGGVDNGGRHVSRNGFRRDCVKYNLACLAGWRLLRFTNDTLFDGSALKVVREALSPLRGNNEASGA